MQMTPYLYFRRAYEEALKFYQSCGLGEIRLMRKYEGTPMAERDGGAWRDKVLHSLLIPRHAASQTDSQNRRKPQKTWCYLALSRCVADMVSHGKPGQNCYPWTS
jgi:uncharacterized glyoxalase superfamily protein PhnB